MSKTIIIFALAYSLLIDVAFAAVLNTKNWKSKAGAGCVSSSGDNGGVMLKDGSPSASSVYFSPSISIGPYPVYYLSFKYKTGPSQYKSPIGGVYIYFYDRDGKKIKERNCFLIRPEKRAFTDASITALVPEKAVKMMITVRTFQASQGTLFLSGLELIGRKKIQNTSPEQRTFRDFPSASSAEIKYVSGNLPKKIFQIVPDISDRTFWEHSVKVIPESSLVISQAEVMLAKPLPELNDQMYNEYRIKGINTYRTAFHARSDVFKYLVLAECFENKGRFVPAIEKAIDAMLAEKTWVLPAHDKSGINYSGRGVTVDLGAVSRAEMLVSARSILSPVLTQYQKDRICREVFRRVLDPYLKRLQSGSTSDGFFWINAGFNWNAVCTANVAYCAVSLPDLTGQRNRMIAACLKGAKCFIAGFPADGYCSEGIGYWSYGFGHFLFMTDVLYQYSGGKINLFKWDGVKTISNFMTNIELHNQIYPAFADCPVALKVKPFVQAVIAKYFHSVPIPNSSLFRGPLSQVLASLPILANASKYTGGKPLPLRSWFKDSEVAVFRCGNDSKYKLSMAVKAGHNDEFHNHNDVGSYVVLFEKLMPCCDPGLEVYTSRTFSKRRYDSKLINSWGHAVPLVNGKMQETGQSYRGKVIRRRNDGDDIDCIDIDLTNAYNVKELKKLIRLIVFDRKNKAVTVTDKVTFSSPCNFGTALITYENYNIIGNNVLSFKKGKISCLISVNATGGNIAIRDKLIDENPAYIDVRPQRIGVDFDTPVLNASISIKYTFSKTP